MKNLSTYLLILLFQLPFSVSAGLINYGSADGYVFAVASHESWAGNLLLGSEAHVFGGVAASNVLELGDGVIVEGDACATTTNNWGAQVAGAGQSCENFSQLATDINNAAIQAQSFLGTDLGHVTGSSQVFGSGFQAFSMDSLVLAGGETLTVSGDIDDYFVFNIFGEAKLGSGANILLQGGVAAENVLFNFVANPVAHSFELGGANISGTYLSSGRSFIIGDGATLNNSRFFSSQSIVANVQDVRFPDYTQSTPERVTSVPEPTTLAILALGAMGFGLNRSRKHS